MTRQRPLTRPAVPPDALRTTAPRVRWSDRGAALLAIGVAAVLGRTLTESFHVPIVMTGLAALLILAIGRKPTAFDIAFLLAAILLALAITFLTILATLE